MKLTAGILIFWGLFSARIASADMMFGDDDRFTKIQDIEYRIDENEPLYLGYRTTITFFIAGIYLTDHGYILAPRNNTDNSYYPLDDETIQELQSQGDLPKPLPPYKIELLNYMFGYSLWIIIFCVFVYTGLERLWGKKEDTASNEE